MSWYRAKLSPMGPRKPRLEKQKPSCCSLGGLKGLKKETDKFGRVPSFRSPFPTIAWFSSVLVLCRWTWCWSTRTFLSTEFQHWVLALPSFEHGSAPHRSSHPWSQAQTRQKLLKVSKYVKHVRYVQVLGWPASTPFSGYSNVRFRDKVSFQISQKNGIGRNPAWTLKTRPELFNQHDEIHVVYTYVYLIVNSD